MSTFVWRSCTFDAKSPTEFLSLLRNCAPEVTPLSDIRVPLAAATVYLCTLFLLYHLPKPSFAHRRSFTNLAAAHNALLSIASLVMNVGTLNAVYRAFRESGVSSTICTPRDEPLPQPMQFWIYVFYISKFYELLDTPILLLRGRPLSLLHAWHHTSVMFEVWSWLEFRVTVGIYGMLFNSFVHMFMYAYYAAALLKIPFPYKKWITTTQIVQFLTSFTLLLPWGYLNVTRGCTGSLGLAISAFLNASYLFLFVRFYRKTYRKKPVRTLKSEKVQ